MNARLPHLLPADERILQVTVNALIRLDPAALTLQRICQDAAVTAPTVYQHFGNKDALVAAAVEKLLADWLQMMNASVRREGNLSQILEQAVAAWETTITASGRPIAVFAWATLMMAGSSEQCRDALMRAREESLLGVFETLQPFLGAEQASGLASLVVDAVLAATVQYELDRDDAALRIRLQAVAQLVSDKIPVGQGVAEALDR